MSTKKCLWLFKYTDLDNKVFTLGPEGDKREIDCKTALFEGNEEAASAELCRRAIKYENVKGTRKLLAASKVAEYEEDRGKS